MKIAKLCLIIFSLGIALQGFAGSSSLCSQTPRLFLYDTKDNPTIVSLRHFEFAESPKKALFQLLGMVTNTSRRIEGKKIEGGKTKLGFDLDHGYRLIVSYELKNKVDRTTGLEVERMSPYEITILSPHDLEEKLVSQVKDFNTGQFLRDFEIPFEVYPFPGQRKVLEIPEFIEGATLERFVSFSSRIGLFSKKQATEIIASENLVLLKVMGHALWFKDFLETYFTKTIPKTIMKRSIEYSILFGGAIFFNHVTKDPPTPTTAATPDNFVWVKDLQKHLSLRISPEAKKELEGIQLDVLASMQQRGWRAPLIKQEKNSHLLDENSLAWVIEKKDEVSGETKTYLALSYDNLSGSIKYVLIQIDPAKLPHLIKDLKQSQMAIKK
jgi:hypothetical protein